MCFNDYCRYAEFKVFRIFFSTTTHLFFPYLCWPFFCYADCHYAKCRVFIVILSITMLSVAFVIVMLIVIMPSVGFSLLYWVSNAKCCICYCYADCHYVKCPVFIVMLSVIYDVCTIFIVMPSVITCWVLHSLVLYKVSLYWAGNTKGGSIIVLLTSCLTGFESAVRQLIIFVFICKTD